MPAHIDRRGFLAALPALVIPHSAFGLPRSAFRLGQGAKPQIRTRGINHVKLIVADMKRSIDFYQGLFGMPAQARSSSEVALRVGNGPQHLALAADPDANPSIESYCLGVESFDPDQILKTLAEHGVTKSDYRGARTVQVATRGDRTDIYLNDPDELIVQLQDVGYCGGTGRLGASCAAVEPAKKGLVALKGYSHITVFSGDAARSNDFYKQLFGLGIRSYQGPTAPTLAIGPTVEFLMFTGGGGGRAGAPARKASINHFCMSLENFNADQIIRTLEGYGIKPRESQTGPVGPMRHYISMRMENRGGAKEGTPELYFTDPDGLLVQLQDVKYCGGSGALGDSCPPVNQ
ncbi:MAG TPA: VOC family protein [Vicinamibacterales bacterium]|nr:VOC family protein [Vicinamibacterales bacterium]